MKILINDLKLLLEVLLLVIKFYIVILICFTAASSSVELHKL